MVVAAHSKLTVLEEMQATRLVAWEKRTPQSIKEARFKYERFDLKDIKPRFNSFATGETYVPSKPVIPCRCKGSQGATVCGIGGIRAFISTDGDLAFVRMGAVREHFRSPRLLRLGGRVFSVYEVSVRARLNGPTTGPRTPAFLALILGVAKNATALRGSTSTVRMMPSCYSCIGEGKLIAAILTQAWIDAKTKHSTRAFSPINQSALDFYCEGWPLTLSGPRFRLRLQA